VNLIDCRIRDGIRKECGTECLGCGTLLTQWTDRRCALATAFPIPDVENPSSRAVLGDVAKLIN